MNVKCDILVSKFAFKFNVYRYSSGATTVIVDAAAVKEQFAAQQAALKGRVDKASKKQSDLLKSRLGRADTSHHGYFLPTAPRPVASAWSI